MSLKTTSITDQAGSTGNNVSSSFDPSKTSSKDTSSVVGGFINPRPKEAPDRLAEQINHSSAPSGATILILDAGRNDEIVHMTNRFVLAGFSMSFQEKVQILETFDASSVSFFGNTAKVYGFQGQAVDYPSTDNMASTMHQSSLIHMYENQLRGTQLLKRGHIAVMKIMNHLVYGYPMNMDVSYNASSDKFTTFNLSWLVTQHTLSVPGWVSDRQLEQLYDPEAAQIDDDKLSFLSNLNALVAPLKNLLFMSENQYPSMSALRGVQLAYEIGGLSVGKDNIILEPRALQRNAYELVKDTWTSFGDNLTGAAKAAKAAIAAKRQSTLGYKSPKLSDWSDTKLDKFQNAASQGISN